MEWTFVLADWIPFIQKLLLLLTTVVLSGLTVPIVLQRIEQRRTQQLKERELLLARSEKLVDAQAAFLDDLSKALWAWRYSAIRVTFYGTHKDLTDFDGAWAAYQTGIWSQLNEVRQLTSKCQRLAAKRSHDLLSAFYLRIVALDKQIFSAHSLDPAGAMQLEYGDLNHLLFNDVSYQIDELLLRVGEDLGIVHGG
jgi:hypothetical protein